MKFIEVFKKPDENVKKKKKKYIGVFFFAKGKIFIQFNTVSPNNSNL